MQIRIVMKASARYLICILFIGTGIPALGQPNEAQSADESETLLGVTVGINDGVTVGITEGVAEGQTISYIPVTNSTSGTSSSKGFASQSSAN